MIEAGFFYEALVNRGVGFFTGVPDSLLKSFCAYITDHIDATQHIIAVNEGAAIGLAAGYHLASGNIPLVYMQNSGLGNATNPLLSLADAEVYSIPMILVIGWRGERGVHDEPQHIKQGKVTCVLLEDMEIPYADLSDEKDEAAEQIERAFRWIAKTNAPFAFVVRKNIFAPYTLQKNEAIEAKMSREEAIEEVLRTAPESGVFISTTGMASREVYELREKHGYGHARDFLTVGSMGHASSVALGIALQRPELPVICLDGDGAVLMHMGALAAIGVKKPRNLRHIVLNNGAHDSVGGQPTIAPNIDLPGIARACGYVNVYSTQTAAELRAALEANHDALTFIEVRVRKGARKDLGRPKSTPLENKMELMNYIGGLS
ncbi:MAG: phosphonopyruvate decarboxylase [Treponema sp.]|jgi:phosphonopyruvate decarboxylase|nr:phosphonopyruvate decarboxylase [Treponema sp.]